MIRLFRDMIIGDVSNGPSEEDKQMLEKYLFWTVDEVACYNKAIDDALAVVRKQWGSSLIIAEIKALKKKV